MNLSQFVTNKKKVVSSNQSVDEIVELMIFTINNDIKLYKSLILENYYNNYDKLRDLKNAYYDTVVNITYKKEPASSQTVKTLPRLLNDKFGDCKHFSTLLATVSKSLDFPTYLRIANYYGDKFTHVYAVAIYEGREIVMDGTLRKFNYENIAKKYKTYKV